MLEQAAACTPALMGFVAKRYGERPASVFSQMDSRERTKLECSRAVQQGDVTTGSVLPAATAGAYEGSGGIRVAGSRSLCIPRQHHHRGRRDITPDGGNGALPRDRVDAEGRTPLPGKDGALAPKGHVPTPEEMPL